MSCLTKEANDIRKEERKKSLFFVNKCQRDNFVYQILFNL